MNVKKIAALILAAGSFGTVAAAPLVTLQAIPSVTCVTPLSTLYQKRINASGTIEAQTMKEVYLETPVIAQSVNVAVGDYVYKDQVLAVIDTTLTKSVLEQSVSASALVGKLPLDQETSDLVGLYSALQSSPLGANLGSVEDLAEVYGAIGESVTQTQNPYIYVPETITAPMEGIVTAVGIKSDVLSRTAKPVVTISDSGSFAALVTVGESYISDIKVGDKAVIEGAGFSKKYEGHVSKIYPVARKIVGGTAQETVVDLEISIDEPDEQLKSGFTARAEILTNLQKDMLTIPYEAVQQDENNIEYVYLIEDSKAVRRDIVTGMELLEGVEVIAGLEATDVIVADAAKAGKPDARIHLKRG